MTYPNTTGFEAHSETSRKSAEILDKSGRAATYDMMIMDYLKDIGLYGATADELRKYLNPSFPRLHNGTVNGRLSALWRLRGVVKTSTKRTTESNRKANVYVHSDYRAHITNAEPEYTEAIGHDVEALVRIAEMVKSKTRDQIDIFGLTIEFNDREAEIIENLMKRAGVK